MREALSEYTSPGATENVYHFVEIKQLINVGHDTSFIDHSGHLCEGGIAFMTRFGSFIHCRHKRRPTIDLLVRTQLAGPIFVPDPGLTLEVGSNNPDKAGVAIPGASVVFKIIINGFLPSLVCGVGVDRTIICVRLGNLELILLLTPMDSTHNSKKQCGSTKLAGVSLVRWARCNFCAQQPDVRIPAGRFLLDVLYECTTIVR